MSAEHAERGPADVLGPLLGRFTSRTEAESVGPYELARILATFPTTRWESDGPDRLHKLAVIAGLARLCGGWVALHAHRALIVGAALGAVASAAGLDVEGLERAWRAWADVQVSVEFAGRPLLAQAEYEHVARRFDRGGEVES